MTGIARLSEGQAARLLQTAGAIRQQAQRVLARAEAGQLSSFTLDLDALDGVVSRVIATTRADYPDLSVPLHARWRHFTHAGQDRWAAVRASQLADVPPAELCRIEIELALVSVLLDAGAGPDWAYHDRITGSRVARSEGLALASLNMYVDGRFSADPNAAPLRVDGAVLRAMTAEVLGAGFQAGPDNPLAGLDGRASLLAALGQAITAQPTVFPGDRLGGFADHCMAAATDGALAAPQVLALVLAALGPIWPGRAQLGGVSLGDCWALPELAEANDPASGWVPFHKLSQWLTYSLVEPLRRVGLAVHDLDGLTGLAEYRNGGLLIDGGVLIPRDPAVLGRALTPDDPVIVSWRALTVALLDRIAASMRERLGLSADTLPLGAVLQGGTWMAGRLIAREQRADGGPPLNIASDGTVF